MTKARSDPQGDLQDSRPSRRSFLVRLLGTLGAGLGLTIIDLQKAGAVTCAHFAYQTENSCGGCGPCGSGKRLFRIHAAGSCTGGPDYYACLSHSTCEDWCYSTVCISA
jgi:hypothetical protein